MTTVMQGKKRKWNTYLARGVVDVDVLEVLVVGILKVLGVGEVVEITEEGVIVVEV